MGDSGGTRQRRAQHVSADQHQGSQYNRGLNEEEAVNRASGGWIRSLIFALCTLICIFAILMGALILFVTSPINPVEMESYPEAPELTGVMTPNNLLQFAERIYEDELEGAESIVVDGDHIYTGTANGCVTHIHQGQVRCLVTFGKPPCGGYHNEDTCGRPLGMRMGKDGFLIVLDAYHGLFKVNVATGDYTTLFSSANSFNGRRLKMLNDLDIGDNGLIYFSHSSSRWQRNQFVNILFEGLATGRLIEFNPNTGEMRQLMDGLYFANGVQLTRDRKSLLVADTVAAKIYRYNLVTGETTVWLDNMPGLPDNIRYCKSSGTYWVGMAAARYRGKALMDKLAKWPWVRGQIAKVVTVSNFPSIMKVIGPTATKAIALEISEDGEIIRSLQDIEGKVIDGASEIECAKGVLYFGSFKNKYMGRLYTKRLPNK